jgi:integrase
MYTVLLLLATTGMRISEVLQLNIMDVDLARGVLFVRQSKFKKSRLIPVSEGTLALLRQYLQLRLSVTDGNNHAPFFISGLGKRYSASTIRDMFRQLASGAQIRCFNQIGPRLHDFRHTFAVTRLLLWYREGVNVMARLPLLSAYLGHAQAAGTQVYLQATGELLAEADRRFHSFAYKLLPGGGRP